MTRPAVGQIGGDSPMDVNEGAKGDQVLRVEFGDDVDLGDFEVIREGAPYREWCVPATLINERATVTVMSEDDVDRLTEQRWFSQRTPDEIAEIRARLKPIVPGGSSTAN